MHRRYTIHRDGDLLVEDLDAQGRPLDPEPVKPEDRLPIEVTVLGPDDVDSRAALIDLLELALGLETDGPESVGLKKRDGHKLGVLS
ncbi:MAG: hypothetical protein INH41_26860 [Myxococcaceae bacterium]|jgi:hypothetical protein|nr:hypothetical protein [Myxococcaceae bacterium]MCA3016021.1 hypothetical protein [Myxococcaceae bacterium]